MQGYDSLSLMATSKVVSKVVQYQFLLLSQHKQKKNTPVLPSQRDSFETQIELVSERGGWAWMALQNTKELLFIALLHGALHPHCIVWM